MTERLILWHRWFPPKQEDSRHRAQIAAWQRSVSARFVVAGGDVLGTIGGSVAAAFDPAELMDVVEVALDLLDEADDAKMAVGFGAALGEIEEHEGACVGEAVERAQLLANRARGGELIVDPKTRAAAAADLLFGRRVAAGGNSVDRVHTRRTASAEGIGELSSPVLPPVIDALRSQIERALQEKTTRTFVLRGPVGAGATELVSALDRALSPGRVLRIGASPGGVVPLASLRLALTRRVGTPAQVEKALGPSAGPLLARVAAGELIAPSLLAPALAELVRQSGERPWVVLSPLSLVDGATLAALLEARASGADFVLFARFPLESPLPRPLVDLDEPVVEHTLPPLKTADARVVAEAILGDATGDDVARRVAVLGGDTVLGVVEAARTLIATGDLVHDGERFVWRREPRHGAHAIGTEELLTERLELLADDARRLLEALCVIPDGSPRELLGEVAALDGVDARAFERGLSALAREALATGERYPRPASSLLRWRMLNLIPPARFTELHRFVSEVLRRREATEPPLRAELGYYLLEGGLDAEARPELSAAVEALVSTGYERAARQLSGWLGQRDDTLAQDANSGARATPPPPRGEFSDEPPPSSEHFLGELLDDASEERMQRVPPPRGPVPRAGAATDAKPPATGANPAATTEKPPATAENPAATAEKPAASAEKPAATGAKPAATGAKPPAIGAKPAATGAKPPAIGAKPPAIGAKPPAIGAKPPAIGAKPPAIGAKPAAIGAKPPAIGAEPPPIGAKPPAIGAKPAAIGAKPAAIGAKPPAIGAKPPAIGAKPPAIGAKPPAIGAKPAAIGAKPPAIGAEPAAIGAKPPAIGAKPPAIGAKPPAIGAEPPAIGAEPPAIGAKPPATGAKPLATGTQPPEVRGRAGGTGARLRDPSNTGPAEAVTASPPASARPLPETAPATATSSSSATSSSPASAPRAANARPPSGGAAHDTEPPPPRAGSPLRAWPRSTTRSTISLSGPDEATLLGAEVDALLDDPFGLGDDDDLLDAEPTHISPMPVRPFVQDTLRALRERDFAALEDSLQRAVAGGSD